MELPIGTLGDDLVDHRNGGIAPQPACDHLTQLFTVLRPSRGEHLDTRETTHSAPPPPGRDVDDRGSTRPEPLNCRRAFHTRPTPCKGQRGRSWPPVPLPRSSTPQGSTDRVCTAAVRMVLRLPLRASAAGARGRCGPSLQRSSGPGATIGGRARSTHHRPPSRTRGTSATPPRRPRAVTTARSPSTCTVMPSDDGRKRRRMRPGAIISHGAIGRPETWVARAARSSRARRPRCDRSS